MRIVFPAVASLLAIVLPAMLSAQDSSGGFTFRSVKPPAPGTKRFITVQIDPVEQAQRLAASPRVVAKTRDHSGLLPPVGVDSDKVPAPAAGPLDWYWELVSPDIADRSGRFERAIANLSRGPDGKAVAAPRMQLMQALARDYGQVILKETIGTSVSPALVLAVMGIESGGRADAVSRAGAAGLMQLMPHTAKRFGVDDRNDPSQNIAGGVAYLDWLMKRFNGDPLMVLAAYNAGEGAVDKAGGVPPYAETRAYVPKVLAAWQVAQGLCLTPPELVSDGCVFRVAANN